MSSETAAAGAAATTAALSSTTPTGGGGATGGVTTTGVCTEQALSDIWTLIGASLVFVMQAGFAMLESGWIQYSHSRNILFKNMLDVCVGAVTYWAFGYAFAYGASVPATTGVIGSTRFLLADYQWLQADKCGRNEFARWVFQFSFAATAATIVSGGVAERAKFQAHLLCALVLTGFVQPIAAHWVWNERGWLHVGNPDAVSHGMLDVAGGAVVHVVGGVSGLVGAVFLGYRNKFSTDHDALPPRFERVGGRWVINDLPPSSEALAALGVLLLWFGWLGFNGASVTFAGGPDNRFVTGLTLANTMICPASAALSTIAIGRVYSEVRYRVAKRGGASDAETTMLPRTNIGDAMNGVLVGLVGITGSAAVVYPWAAVVTGVIAAGAYKLSSELLLRVRVDDPLDVFSVHGACGAVGLLTGALFADAQLMRLVYGYEHGGGLITARTPHLLGAAVLGIVVIGAWVALFATLTFVAMTRFDCNRAATWFTIKTDNTNEQLALRAGDAKTTTTVVFVVPQHTALDEHTGVQVIEDGTGIALERLAELAESSSSESPTPRSNASNGRRGGSGRRRRGQPR